MSFAQPAKLYLARDRQGPKWRYSIRESYQDHDRILSRELYDLGPSPADFIVYPGGNSFYFEEDLVDSLIGQGIPDADRQLEELLLGFLRPGVRRIVEQMTRLSTRRKKRLSRSEMIEAQKRLHLFDRRRMFYLRFGRMDSPRVVQAPHRFLNRLVDMSRDEKENLFQVLEVGLKPRERKNYVYHALHLDRSFQGSSHRTFPSGLDQDRLDQVFLDELCTLSRDPSFLDSSEANGSLSDYLINYVIFWYDYDFAQASPGQKLFEEFIRSRSSYRPPPPPPQRADACAVFSITIEEWRDMDRTGLTRIYRRLALTCHPDHGGSQEDFIEINQAYEVLIRGK